jgi:hypothetical protein
MSAEHAHRALALPREHIDATDRPQTESRKIRLPRDGHDWCGWYWTGRWQKAAGPTTFAQCSRQLAAARRRLKLPAFCCVLTRGPQPSAPPAT